MTLRCAAGGRKQESAVTSFKSNVNKIRCACAERGAASQIVPHDEQTHSRSRSSLARSSKCVVLRTGGSTSFYEYASERALPTMYGNARSLEYKSLAHVAGGIPREERANAVRPVG